LYRAVPTLLLPLVSLLKVEDFEFSVSGEDDSRYITITGYKGNDTAIDIPDSIDNIPVTIIGSRAFEHKGITSVIIPEGVLEIEGNAFNGNRLENIIIPKSVKSIGWMAFSMPIKDMLDVLNAEGRPTYSISVTIDSNVQLAVDLVPIQDAFSLPLTFDTIYIQNGRTAGVYRIEKGSSRYSFKPE
jgi:hypothetical protein